MKISTKYFGDIEIGEEKIIHFENGLLGFEEYKNYTILYDIEAGSESLFSWLQSTDEARLAFPVINPVKVDENYDPPIEDAILEPIGEINQDNLIVFLMATVPADVKEASVNMKAPLIINADTRKGIQVIVEGSEYEIKHKLIK